MNGSIQLTTEQHFQIEQFNRALDTTQDPEQLRQLARQLMQAWQTQKAATCWVLKQDMHTARSSITVGRTMGAHDRLPHVIIVCKTNSPERSWT